MKLFVLEVQYQAYVWAKDEEDAECFVQDVQEEIPEVWSEEVSTNVLGWDTNCLVYHQEPEDLTLQECLTQITHST